MTRVLHLLRRPEDRPPPECLGPEDSVRLLDELPIERLLDEILAHDKMIVW